MSDATDMTIALNVRLKPSEPSAHPRATNYTNVGVAQGIAYVDFVEEKGVTDTVWFPIFPLK
jgi:hypothetical protein